MDVPIMRASVVLNETEYDIVHRLELHLGISFSAAVRIIIREWGKDLSSTYFPTDQPAIPEN